MLTVLMYMMPAAYFLAMLEGMLREGPGAVLYVIGLTVCVPVCMILLVFFLSLGAPNQSGSILIGLIVIFSYMNALDIIALAVFSEAIFGSLISAANAAGDIITIAITDKHEKAQHRA